MKQFTEKEKKEHVRNYLKGKVSRAEYCKHNDIHTNTLYRWQKQYGTEQGKPENFIEIKTDGAMLKSGNKRGIEIRTRKACVYLPESLGKEEVEYIFRLMGLVHVS